MSSGNHLHGTMIMPDRKKISTSFVYAPSKYEKVFWEEVIDTINTSDHNKRLIMGDCNVTLDHKIDSLGYLTDPHKLSRTIINNSIDNETLIDIYAHSHPGERSYTFLTKDCKKRARLDLGLASPSLMSSIVYLDHLAHPYSLTDHSSLFLKLDFTHTD